MKTNDRLKLIDDVVETKKKENMNRRTFLKIMGAAGITALGYFYFFNMWNLRAYLSRKLNIRGSIENHDPIYSENLSGTLDKKVVVVHDSSATEWDFSTGWYGDHVNQEIVDKMVDRGIMELTGASSIQNAWIQLITDYTPGKKIAIKVNFNDAQSYQDSHNRIDALIHPINSIIKGVKTIGIQEPDIWIYDASRLIPDRFVNGCFYKNVVFYDSFGKQGRLLATFNSSSPESVIHFSQPELPSHKLTDVIVNSDYIINIPIIKKHRAGAGVTLSMKNHIGSLNRVATSGEPYSDIHPFIYLGSSGYDASNNPLIEINNNRIIKEKTILIVGDGLYGNWYSNYEEPRKWKTSDNTALNRLFFSKNPVAIDSVMYDFLSAETFMDPGSDDYLHIASSKGMGIHEHRSKNNTYNLLNYIKIDRV